MKKIFFGHLTLCKAKCCSFHISEYLFRLWIKILGLAVLPEFQGRSIGKKLMNHLEMDSPQKLIKFIRLNSRKSRTQAHKFYENIGYVCDKT